MDLTLDTPIRFTPGVGPVMASRLDRLGIRTVEDLLYHVPFRYDDFSLVSDIARVQPGETVTIKGTVVSFHAFFTKTGKKMQEARVSDDTGKLTVVWFNQPYLRSVILPGSTIRLSGNIGFFGNKLVMNSPQYEIVPKSQTSSLHTGRLVPVYPETEGVSSKWLRSRIAFTLEQILGKIVDYTPASIRESHHLTSLTGALQSIHFPSSLAAAQEARRRLAFDELLLLQVRSYEQKYTREREELAYSFKATPRDVSALIATLPFQLTGDQEKSVSDILADLKRLYPMNRLLEGDVGSGKTVVAAIAMYVAHKNGFQSALMAPTQILAEQHFRTISDLLAPLAIRVDLVTGTTKTLPAKSAKNQTALKGVPQQKTSIIIGTHALLSESLTFDRLGLVIIDEQHRFGVTQRQTLMEKNTKGKIPHLLTMTATPIPRTVAKTMFGHLDLSTLSQMPKGRIRVKTWVVPKNKRKAAYEWITKQIKETGGQAFIVCPFIEESESMTTVKAVTQEYKTLKDIFPDFSLGLLHGRMKPAEKTAALERFRQKKDAILVATPVVEVGIDIPNANIMLIEGADRFGLGQLHQLRGRVGRGTLASYCLLFTEIEDEKPVRRLKSLETVFSGPELAEIDLTLRGPGEILGTRQHGLPDLKIASFTDRELIEETQTTLRTITHDDPALTAFPLLRERAQKSTIEAVTQD
jgi:ATP-dependent DNA helicase RecG